MGNHDLIPQFKDLGEWIRHEFGKAGQGGLAKKLKPKVSKNAISMWNTGKNRISPDYQEQIRALGYDGPWPEDEAESSKGITKEDFHKAIDGLESKMRDLESVLEDLAEGLHVAIPSMPPRSRRGARPE